MIAAQKGYFTIYRCSLDALPCGQATGWEDGAFVDGNPFTREFSAFIPTQSFEYEIDRRMVDAHLSPQGLHLIFITHVGDEIKKFEPYTHIVFVPNALLHPPTPQARSPIILEKLLDGKIYSNDYSAHLFASTQSGNYKAVITVDDFTEDLSSPALYLLKFDGDLESPSVQARRLELLSCIDLLKIYAIAIDDRRGVIYLSHETGCLFTIPYV